MQYDRDGIPIDPATWSKLFADVAYKRAARSKILSAADPSQSFDVSTVWMGVDHSFDDGPPLIFETMVFAEGSSTDLDCRRYPTLALAEAGHVETLAVVAATVNDAIVMDAETTAE